MGETQVHSGPEERSPIRRISRAEHQEILERQRSAERVRSEYIGQDYVEAYERAQEADNPLDKARAEQEAKKELDNMRASLVDLMQDRDDKDLQDTLRLAAYKFVLQGLDNMSETELEDLRMLKAAELSPTLLAQYGYEGTKTLEEIKAMQADVESELYYEGWELEASWLDSYDRLLGEQFDELISDNPALNRVLSEMYLEYDATGEGGLTATSIISNIEELPDKVLGDIIRSRAERLKRSHEYAVARLEDAVLWIAETILPRAVERGVLPHQVVDRLSILDGYNFVIVDELYRQFSFRASIGGLHHSDTQRIEVPSDELNEEDFQQYHRFGNTWVSAAESNLYEDYAELDIPGGYQEPDGFGDIVTHEIMHALSRNSEIMQDGKLIPRWSGLRTYTGEDRPVQFTWLNEAITERLNLLARQEARGSYGAYRKLYAALKVCGSQEIPESIFLDAYFTDRDPSDPESENARRELSQAISRAYNSGFLNRLDVFVREKGIDAAIAAIESDPSQI